ncbi:MAG: amino acid decarboxylase [Acidobacteria bacterium]|nr:amino acid decarboxylase [Acidobacteriota bacterium]
MRPHDLSPEEFKKYGYEVVDWIARYLDETGNYPVVPRMQPGDLVDALPASAPIQGEPMDEILRDFERLVVPALNHWNHPRFHGYFSVSASGAGILGEMLAAALNVNGMLWKSCPAAVELEQVVMNWLRQWLGLPETFFGIIHDTASVSTLHAIGAARAMADEALREDGSAPGLVLYTSEHAHSSVEKGGLSLGLGRKYIRKIGVDSEYRMRPGLLQASIAADKAAGLRPFCVVSTAGTTSVTSVDPIAEIQQIAEAEGLWHHVDASYGGVAAMLPENRWMLEGADRAHSLVVNPHKWLFTPIDLSAFFCSRPDMLKKAYSLVPPYLASQENPRAVNLMDYRIPLGSRFRALKLWFVMRSFGYEKVCTIIRDHIRWARELEQEVRAHPLFEVAAPVPMSLVCFRLKAGDEASKALLEAVNASGEAFLSGNVLDGKYVLRIAIGNLGTQREDVFRSWAAVCRLAEQFA